ncbi:hypothetical protein BDW69DRAFT_184445 [Aspergillus filifer]
MAPVTIAPYSHEIYHAVTKSSLHEALDASHTLSAMEAMSTVIRNCFLKHKVQNNFTACINHRHFDLHPSEQNIEEHNGRAMASTNFESIVPCSWLFHEGKLYPYEYRRVERGEVESDPELPQVFIDDLGSIVAEKGISPVIRIQFYKPGIVGMESTNQTTRTSTLKSYTEGSEEAIEATRRNSVIASFASF